MPIGVADAGRPAAEVTEPEDAQRLCRRGPEPTVVCSAAGLHVLELLARGGGASPSISAMPSSAVARPAPPVAHTTMAALVTRRRRRRNAHCACRWRPAFQLRQLLQQRPRERRALAHDADVVEAPPAPYTASSAFANGLSNTVIPWAFCRRDQSAILSATFLVIIEYGNWRPCKSPRGNVEAAGGAVYVNCAPSRKPTWCSAAPAPLQPPPHRPTTPSAGTHRTRAARMAAMIIVLGLVFRLAMRPRSGCAGPSRCHSG